MQEYEDDNWKIEFKLFYILQKAHIWRKKRTVTAKII